MYVWVSYSMLALAAKWMIMFDKIRLLWANIRKTSILTVNLAAHIIMTAAHSTTATTSTLDD